MKISFFVDDLAGNAIVRAAPLAEALRQEGHDVEIIGFLIAGDATYAPYRRQFEYKTIRISGTLRGKIQPLADLATGDLIYCCKPLMTTLPSAVLASGYGRRRPLLLDVEDDELWIADELVGGRGPGARLRKLWRLRRIYAIHPLTHLAAGVSVVSERLKLRYGGTIVLHGPDERVFDPVRSELDPLSCRRRYGLPVDTPLVLFAGTPHPHKGLAVLTEALRDHRLQSMGLVLAGPPDHPGFVNAENWLPGRVTRLGLISYQEMPALLAACDIVPTPQTANDFTQAQIPAKLLEGLAMAKIAIASRVSDLSSILGESTPKPRGWVHAPGCATELADCLAEVIRNPNEARRRADAGRTWYLENASLAAIRQRLRVLIERATSN